MRCIVHTAQYTHNKVTVILENFSTVRFNSLVFLFVVIPSNVISVGIVILNTKYFCGASTPPCQCATNALTLRHTHTPKVLSFDFLLLLFLLLLKNIISLKDLFLISALCASFAQTKRNVIRQYKETENEEQSKKEKRREKTQQYNKHAVSFSLSFILRFAPSHSLTHCAEDRNGNGTFRRCDGFIYANVKMFYNACMGLHVSFFLLCFDVCVRLFFVCCAHFSLSLFQSNSSLSVLVLSARTSRHYYMCIGHAFAFKCVCARMWYTTALCHVRSESVYVCERKGEDEGARERSFAFCLHRAWTDDD